MMKYLALFLYFLNPHTDTEVENI